MFLHVFFMQLSADFHSIFHIHCAIKYVNIYYNPHNSGLSSADISGFAILYHGEGNFSSVLVYPFILIRFAITFASDSSDSSY